jgi:hypothetical protein
MKNATATKYEILPLARGESTYVPTTCGRCGREELAKTVKLGVVGAAGGPIWVGTGCAAVLLGVDETEVKTARAAAIAVDVAAVEAEKAAASRAASESWESFLAARAPGLPIVDAIAKLGGFAVARAEFRATVVEARR